MTERAPKGKDGASRPFRRAVFYIPGFDPFPPRRYRELYRKEGAEQAAISGYGLTLSPRPGPGYGWEVATDIEGQTSSAEMEVLAWSDIVRAQMKESVANSYWQLLKTGWIYFGSGSIRPMMSLRIGPLLTMLYPITVLVVQALLAFAALLVTAWALAPYTGAWAGAAFGILPFVFLLRWFHRLDKRLYAHYLLLDFAFCAQLRGANPPALEDRMRAFGARIRAALTRDDLDEVLVVGHSSGVHIGVSVLADLIREGLPNPRPALGFLSLGQAVPMMSFLPKAQRLRRDLRELSETDVLAWIDVSTLGDGCAFALCDPVRVSGVATDKTRWPLVISSAFRETMRPERWAYLRRRYFKMHFQYLCAIDHPRDYDYFKITGGAQTLAARFDGRAPSPSRLTRAANPFTDTL